jgi:hypothetical protein
MAVVAKWAGWNPPRGPVIQCWPPVGGLLHHRRPDGNHRSANVLRLAFREAFLERGFRLRIFPRRGLRTCGIVLPSGCKLRLLVVGMATGVEPRCS